MKRIKLAWLNFILKWLEYDLDGISNDRKSLDMEEADLIVRIANIKSEIRWIEEKSHK